MTENAIAPDPVNFEVSWYVWDLNGEVYASNTRPHCNSYKHYCLNGEKSIVEHLRDDGCTCKIVILDQDGKPVIEDV